MEIAALAGGVPPNDGVYGLAEIVLPEGSVVNARALALVVAANTETSNRVVNLLPASQAKTYPDHVAGGSYGSAFVYRPTEPPMAPAVSKATWATP